MSAVGAHDAPLSSTMPWSAKAKGAQRAQKSRLRLRNSELARCCAARDAPRGRTATAAQVGAGHDTSNVSCSDGTQLAGEAGARSASTRPVSARAAEAHALKACAWRGRSCTGGASCLARTHLAADAEPWQLSTRAASCDTCARAPRAAQASTNAHAAAAGQARRRPMRASRCAVAAGGSTRFLGCTKLDLDRRTAFPVPRHFAQSRSPSDAMEPRKGAMMPYVPKPMERISEVSGTAIVEHKPTGLPVRARAPPSRTQAADSCATATRGCLAHAARLLRRAFIRRRAFRS